MSDQLTGVIHSISETQVISDKFQKREFVLKEQSNPQYEQYIQLELTQDKCSMLDGYQPGQEVTVNYNLRGRLWTNKEGVEKCFNTIQAWRIEPANQQGQQTQPVQSESRPIPTQAPQQPIAEDDLPF